MRKTLLLICALFLLGSLFATPTLQVIKAHDYTYVNRIVIVFSSQVKYLYKSNNADSTFQIKVFKVAKDESYIEPNLQNSKIVRSITVDDKQPTLEIKFQVGMPYRIEMMTLNEDGYKIVLDIFQKEPPVTFEAGLKIANFYLSTHQFMKAKNLYTKLETTYPDKTEINYYVAKHLVWTKKFEEALARLEKVPQTSREYEFSQILANKLKSEKNLADFQLDFLDTDYDYVLSSPPQVKSTQAADSIAPASTQNHREKRSILSVLVLAQIPLWLALALMLLLIIINAIMLDLALHHSLKNKVINLTEDTTQQPTLFVDEESKRKMISKLSHDGWNNREIAKELHITESEVESVVKQLSISEN